MPRRKTNAIPRLTKTVNVRVPSILDTEIRAECRRHDLPVSHFGRKSFEFFLAHLRQVSSLYEETPLKMRSRIPGDRLPQGQTAPTAATQTAATAT